MDRTAAPGRSVRLARLLGLALAATAAGLTLDGLAAVLPASAWWRALSGEAADVPSLVFAHVAAPRVAVGLLVGASLGLSGVLFQQALRNPLAEPATLGVSSGAYLLLAAASVFAPGLLDRGQEWVALAGGAGAAAAVLCLAWRAGFSTTTVILCGLAVNLLCGTAGSVLMLMNHELLGTLFVWQTGSLVQNGWDPSVRLLLCLAAGAAAAALLVRPLAMLDLDDGQARALGLPVRTVRGLAVALAVALGAFSVGMVGVVGFVGLAAPHAVRMRGARTPVQRLCWAPVAGALLLWLTDQAVQQVDLFWRELPAGSAAALVGSPLLLWLLARRAGPEPPPPPRPAAAPPGSRPRPLLAVLLALLCASVLVALLAGRGADGWQLALGDAAGQVLPWRWPRVAAAAAAGVMLAMAGALLQRVTGNPMASPELLGVSGGAVLGIVLLLLAVPSFDRAAMLGAGAAGALLALGALAVLGGGVEPTGSRLLLGGVALATISAAFASVLLTGGDPRTAVLVTWMSGSTYRVTAADAAVAGATALAAAGLAPLTGRWLRVLPLGHPASRSLGLPVRIARLSLLALVAGLTASATLVVGPVSFVGLLAPHMAGSLGLRRPLEHLFGAAALGGGLLALADWVGRNALFPWQVPAGLVATLVGGPLFLLLLARRR